MSAYHILVAEDEVQIRGNLLHDLKTLLPDAVFWEGGDGAEAAELAKRAESLHIAFLDIRMPKMDGLDVARRILSRHLHCQVIFISAFHDFSYMQEALHLGAANYLLKPFSQTELAAAVQKAISQIQLYRTAEESTAMIRSQVQKYSHLADRQILLQIMNGQQNEETIRRQLEQMDIHFRSGVFALVICPNHVNSRKIGGLLRGYDWSSTFKLFLYEQHAHIFLFALTSFEQPIAAGFSEALANFCQKAERQMHLPLFFAVGEEFSALGNAQKKCFDCYYQLHYDSPYQIFPYGADAAAELPIDPQEYARQMSAFLECAELLGIKQNRVCRNLLLSLPVMLEQFGIPAKSARELTAWADENLLPENGTPQLMDSCRSLCERIEQLSSPRTIQRSGRDNARPLIEAYLEEHYPEDLTLESIAQFMHYSPAYFSKLFKRLFDQTFTSYLTAVRMEHAKQLLSSSSLSVRKVAASVGFQNLSYFTSAFRRLTGCTPTEYRAKSLKKKDGESS